jgi:hypothetical protein
MIDRIEYPDGLIATRYRAEFFCNSEGNRVARYLFDRGFGSLTGFIGMVGVCGTAHLLKKVDRNLSKIFISAITIAEINAIHSWAKHGIGPKEKIWPIYQISF